MKTFSATPKTITRDWCVVDATNKTLGRLASQLASRLRGKHKPEFTPHMDTGDYIVVVNAEKIKVTGKKLQQKKYQRYTGYPSGQISVTLEEMLKKSPTQVIRLAVNRMIPSGSLGNSVKKKLKVYSGEQHPHQAQKPIPLEV